MQISGLTYALIWRYNGVVVKGVIRLHPIERYRKGKGLTQTDLALAVGVNLSTVQRWESGTEPRPKMLIKVAEALGVEPMQLLDEIVAWKQAPERKAS